MIFKNVGPYHIFSFVGQQTFVAIHLFSSILMSLKFKESNNDDDDDDDDDMSDDCEITLTKITG